MALGYMRTAGCIAILKSFKAKVYISVPPLDTFLSTFCPHLCHPCETYDAPESSSPVFSQTGLGSWAGGKERAEGPGGGRKSSVAVFGDSKDKAAN